MRRRRSRARARYDPTARRDAEASASRASDHSVSHASSRAPMRARRSLILMTGSSTPGGATSISRFAPTIYVRVQRGHDRARHGVSRDLPERPVERAGARDRALHRDADPTRRWRHLRDLEPEAIGGVPVSLQRRRQLASPSGPKRHCPSEARGQQRGAGSDRGIDPVRHGSDIVAATADGLLIGRVINDVLYRSCGGRGS